MELSNISAEIKAELQQHFWPFCHTCTPISQTISGAALSTIQSMSFSPHFHSSWLTHSYLPYDIPSFLRCNINISYSYDNVNIIYCIYKFFKIVFYFSIQVTVNLSLLTSSKKDTSTT